MQFVSYDSIKTRRFVSLSNSHNNTASIQKRRGDELQHVIIVPSLILL